MRSFLIVAISSFLLFASSLKCEKQNNVINCTYFCDRSDSSKDVVLKFYWKSPKSPQDDRVKYVTIPPYYGSAYDYRFLPGRVAGRWEVVVTETDNNSSIKTFFDINESDDEFFK